MSAMRNKILAHNDSAREHAMSHTAVAALAPLPFELVLSDGEPLETEWHTLEYPLLRELIGQAMREQGRTDFYAGGNMFVYYSAQQAREVFEEERKRGRKIAFRGPDVFWVGGVDPHREREAWIAWEEGGRLPDVIVELLSPSTRHKDRTEKKDLYAQVFRTAEYFLHDPETGQLEGLRLAGWSYLPIEPDENGRFWSEQLGVSLGVWHGVVERRVGDWVRLYRPDGSLVPMKDEQIETERRRADAAEGEVARLRALLEARDRG
jgi:Uma2 family endonuclease